MKLYVIIYETDIPQLESDQFLLFKFSCYNKAPDYHTKTNNCISGKYEI